MERHESLAAVERERESYNLKDKGITLMALIIMIAIMLILLGVGTKVIVDGKLISTTEKAVNGTNDRISQEQTRVDELTGELASVIQGQCTHEWQEKEIIKETSCGEQGQKKEICKKCDKERIVTIARLPHEFLGEKCTICNQELILGAYVNGYNPSIGEEGEKIETSYTSKGSSTDGTFEKDGTLNGSSGNGYADQVFTVKSIEKWRVTRQDEEGRIVITTADTIQTDEGEAYYLAGQAGFMNYEEELNKICSIYGQGKYADTTLYTVGNGTTKASGGKCINGLDTNGAVEIPTDSGARKTYIKLLDDSGKYHIYENNTEDIEKNNSPWTNCTYYDEENKVWKYLKEDENIEIIGKTRTSVVRKIKTDLQRNMVYKGSDGETGLSYWQEENFYYFAWRYLLYCYKRCTKWRTYCC